MTAKVDRETDRPDVETVEAGSELISLCKSVYCSDCYGYICARLSIIVQHNNIMIFLLPSEKTTERVRKKTDINGQTD